MPRSLAPPIIGILRQSHWSSEDARQVLEAVAATGESFLAFSREHGIDVQRLYAWRRRLSRTPADSPQAFVELPLPARVPAMTPPRYELQLPTGEILRVEGAVDPASVGALLAVLRVGRAC